MEVLKHVYFKSYFLKQIARVCGWYLCVEEVGREGHKIDPM